MAKAVNVKNASSGKAVVVKIEGGGGGGDVKLVSFAETIEGSTYTLTNAADVLDMLEDVVTAAPYPMDAAVKYKVAFQRYFDIDGGEEKYVTNASLNYTNYPGEPPFVGVAGDLVDAFIASGLVDGQVLFGINPGGGMVLLTRDDIDPTTGILTKDISGE